MPHVISATCLNTREIQLQFDQPMATSGSTSVTDISHYALSGGLFIVGARSDSPSSVILSVGRSISAEPNDGNSLSRDHLTYLANAVNGAPAYTVSVANVANAAFSQLLPSATSPSFTCADTTAPTVTATEQPGASTLILTFSEPMDPSTVEAALSWDGTPVSSLANLRWQGNFSDNGCGRVNLSGLARCFARLAVHFRYPSALAGAHTLVAGGTDAAGNALSGQTTFAFGPPPPTVTAAALQNVGNWFRLNVDFSEAMATDQNGLVAFSGSVRNPANYIVRNKVDGTPATTADGSPITVAQVRTDGETANLPRFRLKRAMLILTAGTVTNDPFFGPVGSVVPTLAPNKDYTLEVVNVRSEAGVAIPAGSILTFSWPGDTTAPTALRVFATDTKLFVDYSEDLTAATAGAFRCQDEGGSSLTTAPVTNAADPASYASPTAAFQAAIRSATGCALSDDDTGITFTLPPGSGAPPAGTPLVIQGVRDAFGNLISPNPTTLTTAASGVAPQVTSISCLDLREIQLQFDQPMATSGSLSVTDISHYALSGGPSTLYVIGARSAPNNGVILSVGRSISAEPNDGNSLSRDHLTYLANAVNGAPAYTVSVANVANAAFSQLLPSATSPSFTCADTAPPTVTATEQPGASTLILTFSEPMDPSTVEAALSWDGTPAANLANLRWQGNFSDNGCGRDTAFGDLRCFARLAVHFRSLSALVGAHTLVVGGTDAAGNALGGQTTFAFGPPPPTVTAATLRVPGNYFLVEVDFSESMASAQNGLVAFSGSVNNPANYILRNKVDGTPATTADGSPITVAQVRSDGETANLPRFQLKRTRLILAAGAVINDPGVGPVGSVVPTLAPNKDYTLEVVNVRSEAGVAIPAGSILTFSWPGDTTAPTALRVFATDTKLFVDYSEDMTAFTGGAFRCTDEGGSSSTLPMTNAADPASYTSSNSAFQAAIRSATGCVTSDDATGITFTLPPGSSAPPAGTPLVVQGVRDPFGNLISPNPTTLTVNANTPTGSNVSVAPVDPNTGTTPVTLTFGSITQSGDTTVISSATGPTPPQNFTIVGTYFEIHTTSAFTPPVKVCASYTGPTPRLYHYDSTSTPDPWVDITSAQPGDTTATTVCGFTNTLSPFALMVRKVTPTITWPAPAPITYGTPLGAAQLNATASVPGTFAYSPPAGTVLAAGAQSLSVTFTPADTTSYTTATASVSLTVNKATPTITWPDPADMLEGTPLSGTQLNASASVPGAFTYSPPAGSILDVGAQTLFASFLPTDTANYTTASASTHVRVVNVPPAVVINGPAAGAIYAVNAGVAFSGSFTDPGAHDVHTAQWTFFSGNNAIVVPATVAESSGSGTASATYSFATAGVYYVTLTVTDKDGGSGSASSVGGSPAFVVIYDPSAGYVTGGGWISSPAGAFAADPALTGRATFGFVSQYKAGAAVPTGNTEFQFQVANLNFHSDTYQWLVVGGARAQYKGTGTINGAGSFSFMLTAIDGQLPGGGGIDKFRIKIWDTASGNLVYDNQTGAPDSADPTTAIGGGEIVIHQ